jgi:WD40 repeat protein
MLVVTAVALAASRVFDSAAPAGTISRSAAPPSTQPATPQQVTPLIDPGGAAVESTNFSPSGSTLAAGTANGRIYLWSVASRKVTASLTDPGDSEVESVAFSPSGRTLAAGTANGRIYLWDVATRALSATLTSPVHDGVESLSFSPSGRTLAAGTANGRIYLWDIATSATR